MPTSIEGTVLWLLSIGEDKYSVDSTAKCNTLYSNLI